MEVTRIHKKKRRIEIMSRLEGRVAVITGASGNRSRHGETLAGRRACVVGCDIKDSMPVEHERAVYVKGDLSR